MSCESHTVFYRNFMTDDGGKGNLLFTSLEAAIECFPEKTITGDKCEPVGDLALVQVDETRWRMLQEMTQQGKKFIEGDVPDYFNPDMESKRVTEKTEIRCDSSKPYRVWFLNFRDLEDGTDGGLLFRRRKDALRILKDKDFQSMNKINFIGGPAMTQIHCINRQLLSRHRFIESCDNKPLLPIQVRKVAR